MKSLKKINKEDYYVKKGIEFISQKHISFLKKRVKFTKRKRVRICLHKNQKSKLHEMIIILSKDTYIRPHKHIDKAESLHVIEGSADVIFFDYKGKIIKKIRLTAKKDKFTFYYRLSSSVFHTFKLKSKHFIFHETTEGPLLKKKTIYAKWSPSENNQFEVKKFINTL